MLKKVLILQTAFPGDAILATALLESLHNTFPEIELDILVRKGNESLFTNHTFINKIQIWDKSRNKFQNLLKLVYTLRNEKYDLLINLQRFSSSGLLTILSGAKETRGFAKNPLSMLFTKRYQHKIGDGQHEIDRNHQLISDYVVEKSKKPRLYPSDQNFEAIEKFKHSNYICIAPGSIWFTKTFPKEKWVSFLMEYSLKFSKENIYLLGSKAEYDLCESIVNEVSNPKIINLSGKLSFLESAALMKDAKMNYVNDSAPMHLASAMNARTTALYCSTVPAFGFGPLSTDSRIIETAEKLSCRPCGLHGFKACPEGHFKCAVNIDVKQMLA